MLKQICAACVCFSLVFAIGAHAKEMQKRSNFDDSGAELDTVVIDADDRALDAGVRAIVDRFGQGVKSLTGESRNLKTCVDAKFRVPDTIHVSAHTMLTIVKTAQEFQEATSFEASASTKFLSFSGSASAKLERSTQQNQSTLLVIARTFVSADNPVVIVEEKLSAQAKAAYTEVARPVLCEMRRRIRAEDRSGRGIHGDHDV